MAALPEAPEIRVVDLRNISAGELESVLLEESARWRSDLNWDLTPAAELLRRFVSMQSLNGFALLHGHSAIGYTYWVREDHKGLIGGLYVLESERTPEHVDLLLEAQIQAMWRLPGIRRVESQLLMLGLPIEHRMPLQHSCHFYPRLFMEADTKPPKAETRASRSANDNGIRMVPWTEAHFDASAHLVANAYRGHIDSEINDQYRSPGGARRFLTNIIQYPGCGTFHAQASMAAVDTESGALAGISLASLVAPDAGHITQLCVGSQFRGRGIGRELLQQSRLALAASGRLTVSLTVTEENRSAIALYESVGFRLVRRFAAHVWNLR
ncbi:MAG: GNAT family N-acetyltransferase [Bryobacteraceae bacterium]